MQKIQAVIFDIDGTLANTLPLIIEAMRQAVEPLVQHPLSDEEIDACLGPNEEGSIRKLAPHVDAKKAMADFLHYYESLHDRMCPAPFEGIQRLLSTLQSKGIKLAVATGKGKETTKFSLPRWGLHSFFEIIENGSTENSRKPESIPHILAALGNTPTEAALYVGDSPGDMKDCREVGITAIAAAWAPTAKVEELKKEQPDALFYTLADFEAWLNNRI